MVLNFLRFRQRPPGKTPPPNNRIDVFHDHATGKMVARNAQGDPVPFDAEQTEAAQPPIEYDPGITGLTGGGASKLDGISHIGMTAGALRAAVVGGVLYFYRLLAADLAENAPFVINLDSSPDEWSWYLDTLQVFTLEAAGVNSSLVTTSDLRVCQTGDLETYAGFSASGLTTARSLALPDAGGTVPALPPYANSTAANAAVSVGDAWWDTTLKKARVRLT